MISTRGAKGLADDCGGSIPDHPKHALSKVSVVTYVTRGFEFLGFRLQQPEASS